MNPAALFDLNDKVAIITGGAKGIGKACSQMLAAHGARVMIADFNLDAAEETAQLIRETGGQAKAVACDVLQDADLTGLVDTTLAQFGQINILVNNVGGGGAGRENPATLTAAEFAHVFELNVFSNWRLAQLCAPPHGASRLRLDYQYVVDELD